MFFHQLNDWILSFNCLLKYTPCTAIYRVRILVGISAEIRVGICVLAPQAQISRIPRAWGAISRLNQHLAPPSSYDTSWCRRLLSWLNLSSWHTKLIRHTMLIWHLDENLRKGFFVITLLQFSELQHAKLRMPAKNSINKSTPNYSTWLGNRHENKTNLLLDGNLRWSTTGKNLQ